MQSSTLSTTTVTHVEVLDVSSGKVKGLGLINKICPVPRRLTGLKSGGGGDVKISENLIPWKYDLTLDFFQFLCSFSVAVQLFEMCDKNGNDPQIGRQMIPDRK